MKEVHIKFTSSDKALLDNLLRLIGRAKLELEGVEILAAADSMRWLSRLQKNIEEESKKPDISISNTEPISTSIKSKKDK